MLFCDVTDLQQHHHPQNILHTIEKIEGFPLKAKSFKILQQTNSREGSINPPSVPPWGYDFECTSEG